MGKCHMQEHVAPAWTGNETLLHNTCKKEIAIHSQLLVQVSIKRVDKLLYSHTFCGQNFKKISIILIF